MNQDSLLHDRVFASLSPGKTALPYKWLTVPAIKVSALETDTEKLQIPREPRA